MGLKPQDNTPKISLKKIALKVWPLREEIKAVIEEYVKKEQILLEKPELTLVTEEYIHGKIPGLDSQEKVQEAQEGEEKSKEEKAIVYLRHPEVDEEKLGLGQAFLSEIFMDNISFFSQKKFIEGQSLVIEFLVPQKIILYAEVLFSCQHNKDGRRVINQHEYNYRIVTKNLFFRPGERTLLRRFINSFSGSEEQKPILKLVE